MPALRCPIRFWAWPASTLNINPASSAAGITTRRVKLVNNVDGIAGEELSLNPAGYPTDVANLDESGGRGRDSSGVIHYVRTLDDRNRLVRGRRIGLFGTAITDNNGYFETRTLYDDQGRRMERGNYDASGNLLDNNDDVALIRTTYTIYPDSTQITESYFDASGLDAEEKSSGVHQLQAHGRQARPGPRAKLISTSRARPRATYDGGIHERRYTYDDRSNKLSESFFGPDGKPLNQKSPNYARAAYKYDDKNRVIELAYFGDDGTSQVVPSFGAAVIRQEYDDRGAIVHQQFFDGQGHPRHSVRYGAPGIRIKVEGDTTIFTLRDGDDNPVKNPINGYYAFSNKINSDEPLSSTNRYFDRQGLELSYFPRVSVINPHLHALRTNRVMQRSARLGASATGLGALLGCFLALVKSSHTKRRRVYVPMPAERFLGWFAVFAIMEGMLRFFLTVYWSWVEVQNGRMSHAIYYVEAIVILFFLYRLNRLRLTMRVLNIARDDIHRLVRDFFAKANLKPEWVESGNRYVTPPLDVRVNFFQGKISRLPRLPAPGAAKDATWRAALAQYIRSSGRAIQAPLSAAGPLPSTIRASPFAISCSPAPRSTHSGNCSRGFRPLPCRAPEMR